MPLAPPRLCSCGNIVPSGERCTCQIAGDRARKARHDRHRPSSGARGYNAEWRKARSAHLLAHPFCTHPGCNAPATHVDHITPHKGYDHLFWNRTNWQGLCAHHHNSTKQREERNRAPDNLLAGRGSFSGKPKEGQHCHNHNNTHDDEQNGLENLHSSPSPTSS